MNPSQAVFTNDGTSGRLGCVKSCYGPHVLHLVDGSTSHPVANRLTINSLAEYAEKVPAADLSDLILRETGF
jgi:hypothetical protein